VCSTHETVPVPITGLGTGVLDLLPVGAAAAAAAAAALNAVGDEAVTTHMHGNFQYTSLVNAQGWLSTDRYPDLSRRL